VTHVPQNGIPTGWDEVVASAEADGIGAVSAYPDTYENTVDLLEEDFAESYAAYMHAMDTGLEALDAFRQAYPHRSAYIEQHVLAPSAS
nr:putative zinc-binding metallopeptidase [Gammaproteobacteria bacterium]